MNILKKPAKQIWINECIFQGTDPHFGLRVWQLTSSPLAADNVYCEQLYTSADGSRIALRRFSRPEYTTPCELWVGDLNTHKTTFICEGFTGLGASNPYSDRIFFLHTSGGKETLCALNLKTLDLQTVLDLGKGSEAVSLAVTADEKYLVRGPHYLGEKKYGLSRISLESGESGMFFEIDEMCNPHLQCDPSSDKRIMVQLNRGMETDEYGNITKLAGGEGATIFSVDIEGNNFQYFPAAAPHTTMLTGHECWLAKTGKSVFTTCDVYTPHGKPLGGDVYMAAPADIKPELLLSGLACNHISAASDGRFFIVDDFKGGHIHIGSIESRRSLAICSPAIVLGRPQYSHPHAYLTPGNKWLVYNVCRGGLAHVHIGEIPEGVLDTL